MNVLSIPETDVHALPHEIMRNNYEAERSLLIQTGQNPRQADHHLTHIAGEYTGKYDGMEAPYKGPAYDAARGQQPFAVEREMNRLLMIQRLQPASLAIPLI